MPGRFAFSPVAPLSDKSPLSPTRVLAPGRAVEDSSSSEELELKSRHAVFLGHLDAAPAATPAKRAATLVRTESSVRLLGYFREDEPIVVISAWSTVLGLAKMELKRWAKDQPISELQWMEIGNTASKFSHHLNQIKPDKEQLTISFIKFGRLIRKVATAEKFEKSILLPTISQLYFDIKYMPERLPSVYRELIYPYTVKFAQAIVKLAAGAESSAAHQD